MQRLMLHRFSLLLSMLLSCAMSWLCLCSLRACSMVVVKGVVWVGRSGLCVYGCFACSSVFYLNFSSHVNFLFYYLISWI